MLGRAAFARFNALSNARTDNLQWNMAQLEVELLQLLNALQQARGNTTTDLAPLRQRYDIYYSRVSTLRESALYQELRDLEKVRASLQRIERFLAHYTPMIDGPDQALRGSLSLLEVDVRALHPDTRALALNGVGIFAKTADQQRQQVSNTLIRLAGSILVLVAVLIAAIVTLWRQHQSAQQASTKNLLVRLRLEAMVKSSLDAIILMDSQGRIIDYNPAAETIFGYSQDEAIGSLLTDLIIPPHRHAAHFAGLGKILDTREANQSKPVRVQAEAMRESGETFPVEVSLSTIESDGETVIISFVRDMSEQLEAEANLRRARDEARAGETAKSNLLTVMSHEMRTPLNGILGSVDLFGRDNLDDQQLRLLDAVHLSGDLLLQHVNDVLDLSQLDADQSVPVRAPFDLATLVQGVVESQMASARTKGNRLEVRFFLQDTEVVRGDARRLQRCLLNLIGNAIKFTTEGTILVEVERLPKADLVEFRISDTGIGIASKYLTHIFEDFVTVDTSYARKHEGTGLGLAITQRLVVSMGGVIDADSSEGEGSLFRMRLPLTLEKTAEGAVASRPTNEAISDARSCKTLVIEDNEINRFIVTKMLQNLGHSVQEAENGFQGVEIAAQEQFDLILMDISMPGMDGIEAIGRIRSSTGPSTQTPVVALTAHVAPEDHAKILHAGFAEICTKPLSITQLDSIVQKFTPTSTGVSLIAETDQNVVREYIATLGKQRYCADMDLFRHEITAFLERLQNSETSLSVIVEEAHRLAGSAAVLGLLGARKFLIEIEGFNAGTQKHSITEMAAKLAALQFGR